MKYTNLERIKIFGDTNASMTDDSANRDVDSRGGQLQSYLDMRLIKRWVLPLFTKRRVTNIPVLHVWAGASVTTIDGVGAGSVIKGDDNIDLGTKLDGYTITNGTAGRSLLSLFDR